MPSWARSVHIRMSHSVANARPPPTQKPSIIATTGNGASNMASTVGGATGVWGPCPGPAEGRGRRGALQVVAGGEGKITLAFDDQASRLAFLGQPVDAPDHLRVDLRIEGVSLFRPIDGERGYIAVLLHD